MSTRQQGIDKYCGKLPFASEVCDEEENYAPFIAQAMEEPTPLPVASEVFEAIQSPPAVDLTPIAESIPPSISAAKSPTIPTIYDQPKQQILDTHYEERARSEERITQNHSSQSIDLTSHAKSSVASKAARMDTAGAVDADSLSENDGGEAASASEVKEHRSFLHFLLGFLPGASTPQTWRPAGTMVVLALIMFMGWHVINGKDGLSIWQQKRAEDKRLQMEIDQLQLENARVRDHINSLNTDKDAIEREAREKLHYARSGEIIYALPDKPTQANPAK